MFLPTKHTNIEQSFLGFGGYILRIIGDGLAIDELWAYYQRDYSNGTYSTKQSFDNLILTLSFLFSVNAVYEDNGKVKKCD